MNLISIIWRTKKKCNKEEGKKNYILGTIIQTWGSFQIRWISIFSELEVAGFQVQDILEMIWGVSCLAVVVTIRKRSLKLSVCPTDKNNNREVQQCVASDGELDYISRTPSTLPTLHIHMRPKHKAKWHGQRQNHIS